ncbi:MAG: hypothetical protein KJ955_01185 [Nanoarchaeota archaeon]|nr:hypothetical protein [Nanoarchaeota archaeon]
MPYKHLKKFIETGSVREAIKDTALARSLADTADSDLRFISNLQITPDSARKITANYYDILRSLIEAVAVLKGLKIYSHEGFTAFLRDEGRMKIAEKFDRFRRIRNGIEYFGNTVSIEKARQNEEDMKELIAIFRNMLSEELKKTL